MVTTDTAPFTPEDLTAQAQRPPIVLSMTVEGLGGISDYSVRVEVPAYDDHLKVVANIVSQVNEMVFTLNWPEVGDDLR